MPPLFDVNCEVVNDWANTMKQRANNHCVPAPWTRRAASRAIKWYHSQQPPQNYQSRPLSSANYPPHPTAQRTAPRTIPQQHTVPPQQSKTIAPPRGSITLKSGQQPAPSQQMQHAQSSRPTSSRSSSQASSDGGRGELSDSEKKEKEKFLMFTRVLMKWVFIVGRVKRGICYALICHS